MGDFANANMPTAVAFATGVTAACVAEAVTFPADLVKTNLQIQGSRQFKGAKPLGLAGVVREVHAAEGMKGFYRGLLPSCLRHFIYSGGRMAIYETMREKVIGRDADGGFSLSKGIVAGMGTGATAQFLATPCDLVKIRLQMDGKRVVDGLVPRYTSTVDAYRQILRQGGLRSMWTGWAPGCQRAALVQLGDLTAYDMAKQALSKKVGDNIGCHVLCSLFAGGVAAFMSCPADVIKSRVMNQDPANPLYKGTVDCLKQSVGKEGVLSLWKGLGPAYLRCAPWSLVFFVTFEQLRKATGQASYCN